MIAIPASPSPSIPDNDALLLEHFESDTPDTHTIATSEKLRGLTRTQLMAIANDDSADEGEQLAAKYLLREQEGWKKKPR